MVLEENQFLARSLEHGVQRGLAEEDRGAYDAPYPDPASRRPLLQWPREIPIDGDPTDMKELVERYDARGLAPGYLMQERRWVGTPIALQTKFTGHGQLIEQT